MRIVSIVGVSALAVAVATAWLISSVSGVGFRWWRFALRSEQSEYQASLAIDVVSGQIVVAHHEKSAETVWPIDLDHSSWHFRLYNRADYLTHGLLTSGPFTCPSRYWPAFRALPQYSATIDHGSAWTFVSVPLYMPLLLLAPYPALTFIRGPLRRRRRRKRGLCLACGYNLAGNTTGRCPECGNTVRPAISGQDAISAHRPRR